MTANHTIITGPKKAPTRAVPNFCTMNSPISTITVSGTTNGPNTGVATSRPSTALSTEIAGVIMPSP